MAELSYPTIGGGSVVDANYENLIGTSVPSGLIGPGSQGVLVYGDSSGRQVKVLANRAAMVRGYRWQTDGAGIIRAITANTSGQPRIDLAVLRLNRADWTVTFQVVQGTPAASPVAPSPTQTEGPSGVWELPLANIAVANQASTITAANITTRGTYIGSYSYDGVKGSPPTSGMNARNLYATDVNRLYTNINGSWQINAERGDTATGTALSGWSAQVLRFQRVNGFVWMYAQITRTGANLAADVESNLFNIPAEFRPVQTDFGLVGYAGGTAMRCYLASTGTVILQDYTVPFNQNSTISIHPAMWPALNT